MSPLNYRNTIFNQSAWVLSLNCFLNNIIVRCKVFTILFFNIHLWFSAEVGNWLNSASYENKCGRLFLPLNYFIEFHHMLHLRPTHFSIIFILTIKNFNFLQSPLPEAPYSGSIFQPPVMLDWLPVKNSIENPFYFYAYIYG